MNTSFLFSMGRRTTFPTLIEHQAQVTPQAIALVGQERQWTYQEMQEDINRVAHFLEAQGMDRQQRVGLVVERGIYTAENIVLLLGIMRAGGVYVPIDAAMPLTRVEEIVRDARIEFLVYHRYPLEWAEGPWLGLTLLNLYDQRGQIAQTANTPPACMPCPEDIAYILYTSGSSTGSPKGVMVGHASLAHYIQVQNAVLDPRPGDRATQFFALPFDASFSDLAVLCAGATLCPVPFSALLRGQALVNWMQSECITITTLVPSHVLKLPQAELPNLRLLVVGGEVCPASLVERFWRPWRKIVNAYGLTETTVCCALHECANDGLPPSIGKPLPGVEITIRDADLRPLPAGKPGEIVGAGMCLALGYTDPALTVQRFVADRFSPDPASRLFLTRDRGVMAQDGTICFLGRIDRARRLKCQGKLVELDEVEGMLSRHPLVRECAVELENGRIVAYCVLWWKWPVETNPDWEIEAGEMLAEFLRKRLPAYKLPKGYVFLPLLPRKTLSEKIDRLQLQEIPILWMRGQTFVPATTAIERRLAEIVAELLKAQLEQLNLLRSVMQSGEHASNQRHTPITWEQIDVAKAASEQEPYGLDSMDAPTFVQRIQEVFGVEVEDRELFVPLRQVGELVEYRQQKEYQEQEAR